MGRYKKKQQRFRNTLKDYFSLSNKVRRGLMVLFALMLTEILILIYFYYKPSSAIPHDFSEFEKDVEAFYARAENDSVHHEGVEFNVRLSEGNSYPVEKNIPARSELFSFNPNQ